MVTTGVTTSSVTPNEVVTAITISPTTPPTPTPPPVTSPLYKTPSNITSVLAMIVLKLTTAGSMEGVAALIVQTAGIVICSSMMRILLGGSIRLLVG